MCIPTCKIAHLFASVGETFVTKIFQNDICVEKCLSSEQMLHFSLVFLRIRGYRWKYWNKFPEKYLFCLLLDRRSSTYKHVVKRFWSPLSKVEVKADFLYLLLYWWSPYTDWNCTNICVFFFLFYKMATFEINLSYFKFFTTILL